MELKELNIVMDGEAGNLAVMVGDAVPRIEFVSSWRHGRKPEERAYAITGRDRVTGELKLGVSLRRRNNGMTRIGADLWRLPCDLNARAIELLQDKWRLLNEATPSKVQVRMTQHFGRTHFVFDAMSGRVSDWKDFLRTVLTDAGSFVAIGRCISMNGVSV